MQLAEAFESEQQMAEFVLPAKHTLNGAESFLEDCLIEKWLAAAFGGLPVSGIRVDVRYNAAIENRLPVTRAIVKALVQTVCDPIFGPSDEQKVEQWPGFWV